MDSLECPNWVWRAPHEHFCNAVPGSATQVGINVRTLLLKEPGRGWARPSVRRGVRPASGGAACPVRAQMPSPRRHTLCSCLLHRLPGERFFINNKHPSQSRHQVPVRPSPSLAGGSGKPRGHGVGTGEAPLPRFKGCGRGRPCPPPTGRRGPRGLAWAGTGPHAERWRVRRPHPGSARRGRWPQGQPGPVRPSEAHVGRESPCRLSFPSRQCPGAWVTGRGSREFRPHATPGARGPRQEKMDEGTRALNEQHRAGLTPT